MAFNSKYARRLRQRLAAQQGFRCCYCKRTFSEAGPTRPTIEHRKPKRDGGLNTLPNLAAACFHCNQHRAKQIDQSRQALAEASDHSL
jgi:5-methylcytosine-specific restriction endonuclease McrA